MMQRRLAQTLERYPQHRMEEANYHRCTLLQEHPAAALVNTQCVSMTPRLSHVDRVRKGERTHL